MLLLQLGRERAARVLAQLEEAEIEELTGGDRAPGARRPVDGRRGARRVLRRVGHRAGRRRRHRSGPAPARGLARGRGGRRRSWTGCRRAWTASRSSSSARRRPPGGLATGRRAPADDRAGAAPTCGRELASAILAGLSPELQAEVAHRIAVMDRDLARDRPRGRRALQRKASTVLAPRELAPVGGVQPLVEIINRADRDHREDHPGGPGAARDPELAEEVRSRMFMFEDIVNLEDRAVQLVLRQVETGRPRRSRSRASPTTVRDKVLRNLSERAAENLLEEIDMLGPVRAVARSRRRGRASSRSIRSLEEIRPDRDPPRRARMSSSPEILRPGRHPRPRTRRPRRPAGLRVPCARRPDRAAPPLARGPHDGVRPPATPRASPRAPREAAAVAARATEPRAAERARRRRTAASGAGRRTRSAGPSRERRDQRGRLPVLDDAEVARCTPVRSAWREPCWARAGRPTSASATAALARVPAPTPGRRAVTVRLHPRDLARCSADPVGADDVPPATRTCVGRRRRRCRRATRSPQHRRRRPSTPASRRALDRARGRARDAPAGRHPMTRRHDGAARTTPLAAVAHRGRSGPSAAWSGCRSRWPAAGAAVGDLRARSATAGRRARRGRRASTATGSPACRSARSRGLGAGDPVARRATAAHRGRRRSCAAACSTASAGRSTARDRLRGDSWVRIDGHAPHARSSAQPRRRAADARRTRARHARPRRPRAADRASSPAPASASRACCR